MPSGLRGSERAKGHHRASRPRERRQGLPRRIGRVGAPGLLTPDAVALLVGEPVALRRVIDLALDGFAGDGRAADIARPPGTAARHRDAAREWKTPIREPLAHGLPQHLGGQAAAARDAGYPCRLGTPAAMREGSPNALVPMPPGAKPEPQPSDVTRFAHTDLATQALCPSAERPPCPHLRAALRRATTGGPEEMSDRTAPFCPCRRASPL